MRSGCIQLLKEGSQCPSWCNWGGLDCGVQQCAIQELIGQCLALRPAWSAGCGMTLVRGRREQVCPTCGVQPCLWVAENHHCTAWSALTTFPLPSPLALPLSTPRRCWAATAGSNGV